MIDVTLAQMNRAASLFGEVSVLDDGIKARDRETHRLKRDRDLKEKEMVLLRFGGVELGQHIWYDAGYRPISRTAGETAGVWKISDILKSKDGDGVDYWQIQIIAHTGECTGASIWVMESDFLAYASIEIRVVLQCPVCTNYHEDKDEWSTRQHKIHQCEYCHHEWQPFKYPTIGILPHSQLVEVEA